MTHQEKQLTKNWKQEVLYHRDKKEEEIAQLNYDIKLLNESLHIKEKSIMSLIDRTHELQNIIIEQSRTKKNLLKRLMILKGMIENNDKLTKNNFDITKLFRIFTN